MSHYEDDENEKADKIELSKEEQAAVNSMKRLAKKWPKSLWLYSASGTLYVMKKGENDEQVDKPNPDTKAGGGADPRYMVDIISIENDGGDW